MQSTQNKYATCGKYVLVKPLGSGYNSKVKLGYDPQTNNYYAVKMIKHSHPSLNLKTLKKEIEVLQLLKHDNITNLAEFHESIDYVKKNGQTYKVVAIVMEYIANGELFEYVADSGRFSEKIARTYFRILIETLEYCHEQGITHRDLKPENLLFDADFNLKVADFGFATLLAGKDGSGQLHTILGTESYMAPEIHLRQPYSGPAVDLFASAIILFIMMSGNPPFAKADPRNDPHYKLLCINRHETFWKAHSRNKPEGFYSDDFKNLMNSMLALDPAVRLSLAEVKQHAWYNGDIADVEKLQKEFAGRKKLVDEELERQRQAKQKEKLMASMKNNNQYGGNAFTGVKPMRSMEKAMEDALKKDLGITFNRGEGLLHFLDDVVEAMMLPLFFWNSMHEVWSSTLVISMLKRQVPSSLMCLPLILYWFLLGVNSFKAMEDALKKDLENKVDFDAKREIRDHDAKAGFKAFTEVYTVLSPDFIFKLLCSNARTTLNEFTPSKNQYKIKGKHINDDGTCLFNIEITKVDDQTSCIEFQKKSGNIMSFYDIIKEMKKALPTVECDTKDEKTSN
eukprot:CAMPEP_0114596026 /NCGR_PEP_ID=MMETSP0125-20121206/17967_1 /TAXON_ID=485358 ORGANISM="Aristerostoma sp., Strain ATCC 50986" /NCGR_SAMPLE_ID=MMETSP0125 /ASSEMBLY_ACC=CAM_ASM_000245 /LENGTH=566 /DNA_ID=CAMNT_0001798487 /DNA_START=68 /DNA_END=1768 /DNA_ORIENTATION=-